MRDGRCRCGTGSWSGKGKAALAVAGGIVSGILYALAAEGQRDLQVVVPLGPGFRVLWRARGQIALFFKMINPIQPSHDNTLN